MAKSLTGKQRTALEMLTSGLGYSYKHIAETIGINVKTLYDWRNAPEYTLFQEELKKLNDARWQAAEDAAREGAISLCREGNQKMIEFVLKNCGYNPTNKVEAEVALETVIEITE